jgi:hypothetical protein
VARQNTRDWIPALVAALALAAYVLLLPSGRWQGDDYSFAWLIKAHHWNVLVGSLRWAPRLVGQPIAWLYLSISDALNRPLAAVFLAALWLGCLLWLVWAAWVARERNPLFIAVLLFALTLLLTIPGEMFYWPNGAAAYLPCWAGLAGATLLQRTPLPKGAAFAACLVVAALSLETGAVAVLIFAALEAAATLAGGRDWRRLSPLFLPTLCAAGVCLAVLHGRMQPMSEVMDPASGLAGHWPASLRAALPAFRAEALGIPGLPPPAGFLVKLLLLILLPPNAATRRRNGAAGGLWACALLLAAYVSEAAALHQFGTQCCQRHATQRQALVLLALFSLTGLRPDMSALYERIRPPALAALLIALLCLRAGALSTDWTHQSRVIAARQRSWDSARAPGPAMTLVMTPPGEITNFDTMPTGHFHLCGTTPGCQVPWYALGIMNRFGKQDLTIEMAAPPNP